MIIEFSELQKRKVYKEQVVKSVLISYYRDLGETNGVDIPYFLKAESHYKQIVHGMKDLNHYYNLVMKGAKC